VQHLLVKPGMRGPYEAGDIPGMNLTFARCARDPTVAMKCRVMGHIGFEVKNLRDFSRRLEHQGVKFETSTRKTRSLEFIRYRLSIRGERTSS